MVSLRSSKWCLSGVNPWESGRRQAERRDGRLCPILQVEALARTLALTLSEMGSQWRVLSEQQHNVTLRRSLAVRQRARDGKLGN